MRKKTNRQIVVDRVYRRLKTLKEKGVALRINVTKKSIDEMIKVNQAQGELPRLTKNNRKEVTDEVVKAVHYTSREQAKELKPLLGLKRISDVQKLTGMDLHNEIAGLYDSGMDDEAEGILEAYGY